MLIVHLLPFIVIFIGSLSVSISAIPLKKQAKKTSVTTTTTTNSIPISITTDISLKTPVLSDTSNSASPVIDLSSTNVVDDSGLISTGNGDISTPVVSGEVNGDKSRKKKKTSSQYILTLKPGAGLPKFARKLLDDTEVDSIPHEYDIDESFRGFSILAKDNAVKKLQNHPDVDTVLPVKNVKSSAIQLSPPSWGMTRSSQKVRKLPGPYVYPDTAGAGAFVFIIDTGIEVSHPIFEGRALWGFSALRSWPTTDDNGHGTHVAGIVAGLDYGMAKRCRVVAVKVLDSKGDSTDAAVIAGINYVVIQAKRLGRTVIANMSLGGEQSKLLNQAVAAAVRNNVLFVTAAGNDNKDACLSSPASEPSALTVGAIDFFDYVAGFSNWGPCVHMFAPGTSITSAWNNNRTMTLDGTSMAAPHISGIAALLLGANPTWTQDMLRTKLLSLSNVGSIRGDMVNSPNRLVYVDNLSTK